MNGTPTVLVVDDEATILRLITMHLEMNAMRVRIARNGAEALAALDTEPADLVVLDVMMPEMDGAEALRRIRATSDIPVIMLTASTQDADRVRLLAAGADDCLTKPFNPDELAARVETVLRRASGATGADDRLAYGGLVIDLAQRRVTRQGEEIRLSRTEWDLLAALARGIGKVLPSRHLLVGVWGDEYAEETQYLHTWVSRLRRKLGEAVPLTTFAGVGYQLEPPPKARPPEIMAG